MASTRRQTILITGATGQVGGETIGLLTSSEEVEIVAAVRSKEKAGVLLFQGIASVVLDLDDEETHSPALEGVDRLLLMTGYTVDEGGG